MMKRRYSSALADAAAWFLPDGRAAQRPGEEYTFRIDKALPISIRR